MTNAILLLTSAFLTIIAYWRNDMWLYVVGGLVSIFYGYLVVELNVPIGILVIIFGVYTLIRAFVSWRGRGIVE